jgi:hypothetical protein
MPWVSLGSSGLDETVSNPVYFLSWPNIKSGQPDYSDPNLQYLSASAQVTSEVGFETSTVVTDHPVEMGANISDHAYNKPQELTLRLGWSNSDYRNEDLSEDYVDVVYQHLLGIQASRLLLKIGTKSGIYDNMIITSMSKHTDAQTSTTLRAVQFSRIVCLTLVKRVYVVILKRKKSLSLHENM